MKVVVTSEDALNLESQDSGAALIGEVAGAVLVDGEEVFPEHSDCGLFLRIQSWDAETYGEHHRLIRSLEGKRLRVTIEVID